MNPAGPNRRGGRPQISLALIHAMHADYVAGMNFTQVKKKHGLRTMKLRRLFEKHGLPVRPPERPVRIDPKTGHFQKAKPVSAARIEELIAAAKRLVIPAELRLDWRKWTWAQRADFIARVRARLPLRNARPELPFSANVEPFDYCSPRAQEIAAKANAGLHSRHWIIQLKLASQGVI